VEPISLVGFLGSGAYVRQPGVACSISERAGQAFISANIQYQFAVGPELRFFFCGGGV